jgi:hypothetical protein
MCKKGEDFILFCFVLICAEGSVSAFGHVLQHLCMDTEELKEVCEDLWGSYIRECLPICVQCSGCLRVTECCLCANAESGKLRVFRSVTICVCGVLPCAARTPCGTHHSTANGHQQQMGLRISVVPLLSCLVLYGWRGNLTSSNPNSNSRIGRTFRLRGTARGKGGRPVHLTGGLNPPGFPLPGHPGLGF